MNAESKKAVIIEWAGSEINSGSVEAQVGLLTARVKQIAEHLAKNKHDYSSRLGLLKLVGQRRRLMNYVSKKSFARASALTKKIKA